MGAVQEQLALLREKVARIERRYAAAPRAGLRPARYFIEQIMSGEVVATAFGEHFETERLYERHRRHGSMDISNLIELPANLLDALSYGAIRDSPPHRWCFLDTETSGLAGGTGTVAFLIGVGSIDAAGFRVRQFFMRDFGEEASLLDALSRYLERFDVLITYNGKAYDQPLLETRYLMARARPPFSRMEHLDLLFGARRLWKLRLDSCRLVDLENRILGLEREGDLPGEMIPYYYFDYLRTRQAFRLVPIFHHNAMDIVSLACLTAVVPFAFRAPDQVAFRHGADLLGIARWLMQAARHEEALGLFRRSVDLGLPDPLLFPALLEIGRLEKKLGRESAAVEAFTELAASPNPCRARAFEELAKHYEHRLRDHTRALELTRSALELMDTAPMRQREERLTRKLRKASPAAAKRQPERRLAASARNPDRDQRARAFLVEERIDRLQQD